MRQTRSARPTWSRPASALLLAATLMVCFATPAMAATFNKADAISDDNFRASGSMSAVDIKAFLDGMPGALKSLVTTDYAGKRKSAAVIISDACTTWNVNPKVMLSTLQKEQSLLTTVKPTAKALDWAIGMGVPDSGGRNTKYQGFGNQIWYGTRSMSRYEVTYKWYPGKTMTVRDLSGKYVTLKPANAATFAQYTYTPWVSGVQLFWSCYTRYFGDTHAASRLRPMYRFYNRSTGAYFFTASEGERYRTLALYPGLTFQGAAFTLDTSSTANNLPLYRLYNKVGARYFYTAKASEKDALLKLTLKGSSIYKLDTIAGKVSLTTNAGPPVWRLYARSTNSYILTSTLKEKDALIASGRWKYQGVAFYLGTK